jgi:glycosyltransferase involved in cell wall biosynthesis
MADSEATRRDLARFYGVAGTKVAVVYPGRDESLRRVDPAAVRARYGLDGDYVLHVGTLQPRKNLGAALQAFERVSAAGAPHALVVVGASEQHARQHAVPVEPVCVAPEILVH